MADDRRTLIVTGASSGIGAALASLAAAKGDRLVIVARRAQRLEAVAEAISSRGGSVVSVVGDVTAADVPTKIVDAALRAFGRIDVVVNNAGGSRFGALLDQSDAAIAAQWNVHVAAPLRLSRAALPHLERTHGQLVFIGSGAARVPLPNYGAYALAKAAIRAAANQLRRELRARGVAVTYVDPGIVATEFHSTMGIVRAQSVPAASPAHVARAILRGIARRSVFVNAVPWQTAGTALGELSGVLADSIVISRFSARRAPGASTLDEAETLPAKTGFVAALEPAARRMQRVQLPADFLRAALVPGATLELNALAMQWAGMPNKNERAVMREALDALCAAGYLKPAADETWNVVRAPD